MVGDELSVWSMGRELERDRDGDMDMDMDMVILGGVEDVAQG